ncbi:MAG: DMT family transporter [Desulfobacteraceae bacterium]|nr:DMT family transporter [Desulfobacteraceae bacterium]
MSFSKFQGDRFLGIIYIIISAASFGAMPIFANIAYRTGASSTTLLFLRFSIASVIMLSWLFIRRSKYSLPKAKVLVVLILMGGIGYGGQSFCYFTALTFIPSGTVAILLYLYPALVTGLSILFLNQKITLYEICALILALSGTLCVVGLKFGGQGIGYIFGVSAAFIYATYIIVGTKALNNTDSFVSSTVIITTAAMLYFGVIVFQGPVFPSTLIGWTAASMVAIVSTIIAIIFFFAGLKKIGPVHASMLSTVEPVVTVLLAWLFLGELLGIYKIIGGIMVLTAGMLLAKKQPQKE